MFEKPKIFVVSAPSGGGKTTLNSRLVAEATNVDISVSHTTRPPRPGEKDGVHYYFTSREEFEKRIASQEFLEHATVHGHLYGTSLAEVDRIGAKGHSVILEIDVQGWVKARPVIPHAVSIFILPPNLQILWQRLERRGSDTLPVRWLRFQNAYHEIENAHQYQYFIVNDELEIAYRKLKSIVVGGIPGDIDNKNGQTLVAQLKAEFRHSDWIQRLMEDN